MKKIRRYVKRMIGKSYSVFDVSVIVNSYGRSGSTMLLFSAVDAAGGKKPHILKQLFAWSTLLEAWDLNASHFEKGLIYKTHDYPPHRDLGGHVRIIYIFADPVEVVLSLLRLNDELGEEWMKEHYEHLRASYGNFNRIIEEDQLGLERHLDSWLNEKRFPVAFVRYDKLWDHQKDLSDFLGVPVQLPPYEERKAKKQVDPEVINKLETTYSSLRKKVDSLDGFFKNSVLQP